MAEKITVEWLKRRIDELEKSEASLRLENENLKKLIERSGETVEPGQTEEALKAKARFLQNIIDFNSDLISVTDMNGNFTYISPSHTVLGWDPSSLIGRNVLDLVHPEDVQKVSAAFSSFLTNREDGRKVEYRCLRKDGSYFWLETVGKFLFDEEGNTRELLFISRDFSERKRAEGALELNYALLKTAGETAHFGGWSVNLEDNTCTWSDAVADIHDEPHGFHPSVEEAMNYYAPEWRDKILRVFSSCAGEGVAFDEEMEIITRKGRRVWVRTTGKAVKDRSGSIVKVQGSIQDITEKKLTEKALKESEERFHLAMEASRDGIYEWDLETKEIYYSPGWKRMLGYEPHELPDDFSVWETLTKPEDVEKSWRILNELIQGKRERFEVEFEMLHKDGHWVHILSRAKIYQDAAGKPVRVVGTHVDISESIRQRKLLRLSESRYIKAQELAKVGNWEYNLETGEFWGSDEAKKIYGFDPDKDLFSTEEVEGCIIERERVHQALVDLIENEKPYNLEFDLVTKDTGEVKTIISIAELEKDGAGKPVKVSGVIHDITERKQAEKMLREREALFRGLFDNMTSGSAIYEVRNDGSRGADYIVKEFNRKSLEMEGKKLEEVLGRSLYDLRPRIDDYGLIPVMKKVWETGIPEYFPSAIYTDGNFSNYYENFVFKVPSGEVVTIYNDVTDEKNREKDLQESEARFKALHNASFGGITIHDKGIILECNQGLSEMTGYSMEELIGMNGLLLIAEESRDVVMTNILAGYEKPYEAVGLRKNGEEYPVRLEARNIPYKGKQVRTVEFRDITEQKKAEAEKEKLQVQLTQALKMESVGRLAGGVAHDFNNMLGVILGHTELALLKISKDSELYRDLLEVQTAAKRSADITKQLLAFARKEIISPRHLDLNDTLESMLNMLRRLIGEDITLSWRPHPHLWPVKMDPSQIDQILVNLCVNARDAIGGVGRLTIETGMKTFDQEYCRNNPGFIPGDYVMLSVSDNGRGMDRETLGNLFEPFYTTKERGKGTGLGLATVYGIVKQNNGFINVYSEPEQGSTFNIYLPRLLEEENHSRATSRKNAVPQGTETILLVEDELAILAMTRMMLEKSGYSVLSASTPAEAEALAEHHAGEIHLIMTDVIMPEMNGRDLAGIISRLYPGIRLLFMSGYTADVIAHQGVLDEGVAFLQKPFSLVEMAQTVRDVLDGD